MLTALCDRFLLQYWFKCTIIKDDHYTYKYINERKGEWMDVVRGWKLFSYLDEPDRPISSAASCRPIGDTKGQHKANCGRGRSGASSWSGSKNIVYISVGHHSSPKEEEDVRYCSWHVDGEQLYIDNTHLLLSIHIEWQSFSVDDGLHSFYFLLLTNNVGTFFAEKYRADSSHVRSLY